MQRERVRTLLNELAETIREERHYATALDLPAMTAATQKKLMLVQQLEGVKKIHPEEKKLLQEIRTENYCSAYLFRESLKWIQNTMQFFGRATSPLTYGHHGTPERPHVNGRLLSGRI